MSPSWKYMEESSPSCLCGFYFDRNWTGSLVSLCTLVVFGHRLAAPQQISGCRRFTSHQEVRRTLSLRFGVQLCRLCVRLNLWLSAKFTPDVVAQVRKRVKSGTVALRVKCDVVEARGRRGWMRCFVLGFFGMSWHPSSSPQCPCTSSAVCPGRQRALMSHVLLSVSLESNEEIHRA